MTKEERIKRLIKDLFYPKCVIIISREDYKNRLLREFKDVWSEGYIAGYGDATMEY